MLTPPFVLLPTWISRALTPPRRPTPKLGKSRSAPSSQYSYGTSSSRSGSPRRHPASSHTSFDSPTKKEKSYSLYAPLSAFSDPAAVFPPTPPRTPTKASGQRSAHETFPFVTPPRTPNGRRGSTAPRKTPPSSRKPLSAATSTSHRLPASAGPLRTRFYLPYETLIEEDREELESACESLEADVISHETMLASKRMTEPRKSLP